MSFDDDYLDPAFKSVPTVAPPINGRALIAPNTSGAATAPTVLSGISAKLPSMFE